MKKLFLFACFLFLIFGSCYETKKGCLDLLAANYDASADEPFDTEIIDPNNCQMCCTYPNVIIELSHKLKDTLRFSDANKSYILTNNIGNKFLVLDQKFHFSEIEIFSKSKPLPFVKQTEFSFVSGKEKIYNNTAFFQFLGGTSTINTIRSEKNPDSISLIVGVNNKFDALKYESIPNTAQLRSDMYDKKLKRFISYTSKIVSGPTMKDTMEINIFEDAINTKSFNPIISKKGQPISVKLIADYDALYNDVEFSKGKSNQINIEKKLFENFKFFVK